MNNAKDAKGAGVTGSVPRQPSGLGGCEVWGAVQAMLLARQATELPFISPRWQHQPLPRQHDRSEALIEAAMI